MGRFPTTEQGLGALMARPQGEEKWGGPYLKKAVPPDPWGRAFHYRSPGEHGDFDLASWGADGQPGGQGEAQDAVSWGDVASR